MGDAAAFLIMYHSGSIRYGYYNYKNYGIGIGLNEGPKPLVHTFVFHYNVFGGLDYYLNGIEKTTSGSYANSELVSTDPNFNNVKIGYKSRGQFKGYVSEFIVFDRALKNSERQSVENYSK